MTGTVNVGTEHRPFIVYFPKRGQGKNLEPAGVGEDIPVPIHKLMKPTGGGYYLGSGPEVQMVGIGQDDLKSYLLYVIFGEGFDGSVGSYGHKYRGKYRAMG
jgi:hypothetical protein